jgi:ABC-2 type transport system ATP-binding protein
MSQSAEAVPVADPIVSIEHVSKLYGRVAAVEDVTLHVRAGEVLGLLGPNGSGKTTLLRVLTGYFPPTSGRVAVAGHDTERQRMEARRHIGYVPESLPLYPHMRVREFWRFMARLRGLDAAATDAAIAEVAEQVALADRLTAPIRTLSRGYRQRVAIGQALLHRPDVLVLDEPTNGLDPRQIIETRHVIRGLAGRRTVIMSSHILSEVEKVADRVAILLQGRLLSVQALTDTPDLEALFLSLT